MLTRCYGFNLRRFYFSLAILMVAVNAVSAQTDSGSIGFSGSRVAADGETIPTTWDDKTSVKWKFDLPGPGASSPIVVGDKLFVTSFSGYAVDSGKPGELNNLTRLLICIDRETGEEVWQVKIKNGETEDAVTRQISDHGYASSTPVCDGEHIFSFFGKAGMFCHDLNGQQIWQSKVGSQSSQFKQGSGSSPVLFGDTVIINASDEARAIIAFDKSTGEESWRTESEKLDGSYVTPKIMETVEGKKILVVSMIGEAWGLDPNSGEAIWSLETDQGGSVVPTPVGENGNVFLFGGMGGTTYALKADLNGRLTSTDATWTSRNGSIVPSPLVHDGHLYWADMSGIAHCIRTSDGSEVYKQRLGSRTGCYSSPVMANGNIYFVSRTAGTFVVPARPEFAIVAHNVFRSDESRFDGTPAIADGRLFLRSCKAIYCVGD